MGWRSRRRGRGRYGESFWPRYVSVGERRDKAQKQMEQLRKKGKEIQPVSLNGRIIAATFWGKAWCDHLESFSDYENRLPRGRTYVRNGSVCHLEMRPGVIKARVSGSSLYTVTIRVKKLPKKAWEAIKEKCSGQIGSMLELLQGKLSDKVMAIVADRKKGLFPQPGEMELECSCPDWATMCKHVAAVLYGVGSRLDTRPELLFLLREVNAEELIFADVALPAIADGADVLAGDQLGAIFGIELESEADVPTAAAIQKSAARPPKGKTKGAKADPAVSSPPAPRARRGKSIASKETDVKGRITQGDKRARGKETAKTPRGKVSATSTAPEFEATGTFIAGLRARLGLTVIQFARKIGVVTATVRRWEETPGPLRLQSGPLKKLRNLGKKATSGAK